MTTSTPVHAALHSSGRIHEIDLLRLIAALAVVVFHFTYRGSVDDLSPLRFPLLAPVGKYGYLGVQLFFMISGFVILMSAAGGSLKRFVISRLVRLYPALWACCSATFILILLIGAPAFSATFKQYVLNMSMLNAFLDVPAIDGVYWSLYVEIKFYLLMGLILLLGKIRHTDRFLLGWLALSVWLEVVPVVSLRYWLATEYAAFFIAGAFCYMIRISGLSLWRLTVLLACWCLACWQSVARLQAFERHFQQPYSAALVMFIITLCFGVMLLVALGKTGFWGQRRWQLAGALTYPLYLLHQNIGFMLFKRWHALVNDHVLLWGMIALMLLCAYAVHRLVERPLAPLLQAAVTWIWVRFTPQRAP